MADSDEKKLVELSVRVVNLEEDARRSSKYTHVMLEDLIHRIAKLETAAVRFETNLVHVNGNGDSATARLRDIEERLRSLERLAWVAIGGLATLTGVAGFLGWQVLKLLVR